MRTILKPEIALLLRDAGFSLPVLHCYRHTAHYDGLREDRRTYERYYYSWDLIPNPLRMNTEDGPLINEEWYESWEKEQYIDSEGYYIPDDPYFNWNQDWKKIAITWTEFSPKDHPDVPEDFLLESIQYSSRWNSDDFASADWLEDYIRRIQSSYPELLETDEMMCCTEEDEVTGEISYNPLEVPVEVIPDVISAPTYGDVLDWLEKERGLHIDRKWTGTEYELSLSEFPALKLTETEENKNEMIDLILNYINAFDV